MNKSFRSIWNEALGAWVAASEGCTARRKKSSSITIGAALLATAVFGSASPAWAANGCGAVASGGTCACRMRPGAKARPIRYLFASRRRPSKGLEFATPQKLRVLPWKNPKFQPLEARCLL